MKMKILVDTTSDSREHSLILTAEPLEGKGKADYFDELLYGYDDYNFSDEDLTKMSMNLSQSSLAEVWDNEEDDHWDNI